MAKSNQRQNRGILMDVLGPSFGDGLTPAGADALYLRLDGTNDPMTGDVTFNDDVAVLFGTGNDFRLDYDSTNENLHLNASLSFDDTLTGAGYYRRELALTHSSGITATPAAGYYDQVTFTGSSDLLGAFGKVNDINITQGAGELSLFYGIYNDIDITALSHTGLIGQTFTGTKSEFTVSGEVGNASQGTSLVPYHWQWSIAGITTAEAIKPSFIGLYTNGNIGGAGDTLGSVNVLFIDSTIGADVNNDVLGQRIDVDIGGAVTGDYIGIQSDSGASSTASVGGSVYMFNGIGNFSQNSTVTGDFIVYNAEIAAGADMQTDAYLFRAIMNDGNVSVANNMYGFYSSMAAGQVANEVANIYGSYFTFGGTNDIHTTGDVVAYYADFNIGATSAIGGNVYGLQVDFTDVNLDSVAGDVEVIAPTSTAATSSANNYGIRATVANSTNNYAYYADATVGTGTNAYSFYAAAGEAYFADVVKIDGLGTGGLTDYDLEIGGATYGMMSFGSAIYGKTSYNVANLDLDGTVLLLTGSTPATSNMEFCFVDSTPSIRLAIPKAGAGNAFYNPRSMIIAGPAPFDDECVTIGYWTTEGSLDSAKIPCDTGANGADLGVQNNVQIGNDLYVDNDIHLETDGQIEFRDTTTYINSTGSGTLHLENIALTVGGLSATWGDGTGAVYTHSFDTTGSDGGFSWVGASDYFSFADDIIMSSDERLYLRDTAIYLRSQADGEVELVSDSIVRFDCGASNGVIIEDLKWAATIPWMGVEGGTFMGINPFFYQQDNSASGTDCTFYQAHSDYPTTGNLFWFTNNEAAASWDFNSNLGGDMRIQVNGDLTLNPVGVINIDEESFVSNAMLFEDNINLTFGTSSDVTFDWNTVSSALTMTGGPLRITINEELQFRDSALAIYSSSDGVLNVKSDVVTNIQSDLIVVLEAPQVNVGGGAAGVDYRLYFNGENSQGAIDWMEDEDYFKFLDDTLHNATERAYFRDTGLNIYSSSDGILDIESDGTLNLHGDTTTNVGVAGDIALGDSTLRKMYPANDEKMDLGDSTHVFNDLHIKNIYMGGFCSVTTTANSTANAAMRSPFDEDTYTSYTHDANVTQEGITYTTTDGRFTIDSGYDGVYLITCTLNVQIASSDQLDIEMKKNGTAFYNHDTFIHSSVDPVHRTVTVLQDLVSTDFIEVTAGAMDGVDACTFYGGCTFNMVKQGNT